MPANQLWFWPPPRPLVDRFGGDFFRQIPGVPGVYFFCGADAGILYVGKAKNLRRRLSTYRVANPERLPRRMIRLLHEVRRIEWDVCVSESAARHREALLISVLNPKYNRAGRGWPDANAWRAIPLTSAKPSGNNLSESLCGSCTSFPTRTPWPSTPENAMRTPGQTPGPDSLSLSPLPESLPGLRSPRINSVA